MDRGNAANNDFELSTEIISLRSTEKALVQIPAQKIKTRPFPIHLYVKIIRGASKCILGKFTDGRRFLSKQPDDVRSIPELRKYLAEYNELCRRHKYKAPQVRYTSLHGSKAKRELVNAINEIVYLRSVHSPRKLSKTSPFSSEAYGESDYRLIEYLAVHLDHSRSDIIIDLGSGVGNIVLAFAALCHFKKCFGIEKRATAAQFAPVMEREFRFWMDFAGMSYSNFELIYGDFLSKEYASLIRSAKFIFVNNYEFDAHTENRLCEIFSTMQHGTKIIAARPFLTTRRNNTKSQSTRASHNFLVLHETLPESRVSWTSRLLRYTVQVVNRKEDPNPFSTPDVATESAITSSSEIVITEPKESECSQYSEILTEAKLAEKPTEECDICSSGEEVRQTCSTVLYTSDLTVTANGDKILSEDPNPSSEAEPADNSTESGIGLIGLKASETSITDRVSSEPTTITDMATIATQGPKMLATAEHVATLSSTSPVHLIRTEARPCTSFENQELATSETEPEKLREKRLRVCLCILRQDLPPGFLVRRYSTATCSSTPSRVCSHIPLRRRPQSLCLYKGDNYQRPAMFTRATQLSDRINYANPAPAFNTKSITKGRLCTKRNDSCHEGRGLSSRTLAAKLPARGRESKCPVRLGRHAKSDEAKENRDSKIPLQPVVGNKRAIPQKVRKHITISESQTAAEIELIRSKRHVIEPSRVLRKKPRPSRTPHVHSPQGVYQFNDSGILTSKLPASLQGATGAVVLSDTVSTGRSADAFNIPAPQDLDQISSPVNTSGQSNALDSQTDRFSNSSGVSPDSECSLEHVKRLVKLCHSKLKRLISRAVLFFINYARLTSFARLDFTFIADLRFKIDAEVKKEQDLRALLHAQANEILSSFSQLVERLNSCMKIRSNQFVCSLDYTQLEMPSTQTTLRAVKQYLKLEDTIIAFRKELMLFLKKCRAEVNPSTLDFSSDRLPPLPRAELPIWYIRLTNDESRIQRSGFKQLVEHYLEKSLLKHPLASNLDSRSRVVHEYSHLTKLLSLSEEFYNMMTVLAEDSPDCQAVTIPELAQPRNSISLANNSTLNSNRAYTGPICSTSSHNQRSIFIPWWLTRFSSMDHVVPTGIPRKKEFWASHTWGDVQEQSVNNCTLSDANCQ